MSTAELDRQMLVQRLMALQNQIAYLRMAIATEREECNRNISRIVNEMRAIDDEVFRLSNAVATSPEEAAQIEEQKRRLLLRHWYLQISLANERARCNQRLADLQNELNQLLSEFGRLKQQLFRLGGAM
jgi:predicted  nucleic acid-binding Zn-ribbon protein